MTPPQADGVLKNVIKKLIEKTRKIVSLDK